MTRPRLVILGGPDVDKRLDLMDYLHGDYEVIGVGSDPELVDVFGNRGYAYHAYPLTRSFDLKADWHSCRALRKLLKHIQPHILQSFDTKPNILARIAAHHAKVPLICGTQPGLGALYTYSTEEIRERRALFDKFHRRACRVSHVTVFQNQADLNEFVTSGIVSKDKSRLIPGSGVSSVQFTQKPDDRDEIRRKYGFPKGKTVVLTAARLIRSKGVLDVVDAAAKLAASGQFHFVIAGGEDPEALDALNPGEVEWLKTHTQWLGEVADMAELMGAVDVFAFMSYYREGIPRVLIEAAYSKLPMIATDVGGNREVVTNQTGLLVPVRRSDLLCEALQSIRDDRSVASERAESAWEYAQSRFELAQIADQYKALYRELAQLHLSDNV